MRPPGVPQEEQEVLAPVERVNPVSPAANFANEIDESFSQSYAGLDIISFDNFIPPHLKHFGTINSEGCHEPESAREGLTIFTDLPTPILDEPISLPTFRKARSKTQKIIDIWGKSPEPGNSKSTIEDTNNGNTSKSHSKNLQLAGSSTNREIQHMQGEFSLESCGRPDLTRSMLYNWHLLRMDNIRILGPLWEGFGGSPHDYELLRLLAQTHEYQRWWLIVVDDFACPQCVETLGVQQMHPRSLRKAMNSLKSRCTRHPHYDGGYCKVVTQFFSKLGRENSNRMRNIVFETREDLPPDADVLVSVAHNTCGLGFCAPAASWNTIYQKANTYASEGLRSIQKCRTTGPERAGSGTNRMSELELQNGTRLFSASSSFAMAQKITNWVDPKDKSGEFKRGASVFRNTISREAGAEFPAEKGRYHLYVSYACPWAHRTLIVRKLKGLEDIVPFTAVHWHMGENGWRFATADDKDAPGENVGPDPVKTHEKYTHLRQIYFQVDPDYTGRFTVPTLYDTVQNKIVSNESADIIRMFYTEFDDILPQKYKDVVLFPEDLRAKIEETNSWTYDLINNGVYKSGFATTPEAYEKNVIALFEALDKVEKHLESSPGPFYWGDKVTEGDVRLYTTIVRFDAVYVQHFKTNIRDIRSGYPAIHKWLRNLYWNVPAFGETTQFEHIKRHYTKSHPQINPFGITPVGPLPDILKVDEEVNAVKSATN
ncbi:hypothetical protein V491_01790 [Pseudogymnoascus sp. VKM F-3775]|nr:hypothetical protein V491_01790 [Pseudogymnoascus sp. VKM F-3775]